MDIKWTSEDVERTTHFTVTDVDPMAASTDANGRSFQPEGVTITVSMSVSLEDPEPYGPRWEATVRGHFLKADGSVGKQECAERLWQGNYAVPAWLDVLGRDCVTRAELTLTAW